MAFSSPSSSHLNRHSFSSPPGEGHLALAFRYWSQVNLGDSYLIDATAGNGRDTLRLCELTGKGKIYAFDVQAHAIQATKEYLHAHLSPEQLKRIHFEQRCHRQFPSEITSESVGLVVYNLGYLPGGNKAVTTHVCSTLESIRQSKLLLISGGMISVTCYPGHAEGKREEEALLDELACWPSEEWSCCHHRWLNRKQAPSLLIIQRAFQPKPTTAR